MANLSISLLKTSLKRKSAFQAPADTGTGGLVKHMHFYCRIFCLCWLSAWGPGSMP